MDLVNAYSILITGGTGKIGSRLNTRLDRHGVSTRVGSRRGQPSFDWTDSTTWDPALDGCDAVFVAYAPDIGFPGADNRIGEFAVAAPEAGVERIVLLSGRGEPGAARAERRLRDIVPSSTILRCAWFDQNFSESFLLDPVRDGVIALPVGDVVEPFLDADDIADVALRCLTDPSRVGQTLELTGPELLSFARVAASSTR